MDFYWKVALMLKEMADKDTIVITRTPKVLPYLLMIPNRKFKIYYETHNFFYDLKRRDDLNKKNLSLYKNAFQEKISLKKIDGLICLTETQKALWEKYVNLPIHVIYPGMISAVYNPKKFNRINLVYTGSLDEVRGIDHILEMACYLPNNYYVYLIGGMQTAEIKRLYEELKEKGVDHKVTITGWLNQAELQKQLSEMHLGLLPLKDNFFNRYLTAPSKLFDYLSHSLPVVASHLPSLEELVQNNNLGILADWNQPDKVAKQIVQLVSDPKLYNKISGTAYAFALEHTWEKRGERIVKTFFG
ncbi:MAG: glycosyltransferase [Bacteroidales bacterium]